MLASGLRTLKIGRTDKAAISEAPLHRSTGRAPLSLPYFGGWHLRFMPWGAFVLTYRMTTYMGQKQLFQGMTESLDRSGER